MYFVLGIYGILIVIFMVTSVLIVRHMVKFSYLSQRFRSVVFGFGIVSVIVIVFSLFLVFNLVNLGSGGTSTPTIPTNGGIDF